MGRTVRWVVMALAALALGAAVVMMGRPAAGPLQAGLATVNATETTLPALVGQWVAFGGYNLESTHPVAITVLAVRPTAVPDGVVAQAGLYFTLPGQSAIGALRTRVSTVPLPHALLPNQVLSPWPWQVVLNLKATKPGTFSVPGLAVTYLARGQRYTVFYPDRFVLCAGRHAWPRHCP
jgi:hypothetical protein